MLKGVIFDLDGVIVDSHPVHRRAWKRFLEHFGQNPSEAELEFVLDGRKKEEILRHFLGDLTPEQIRDFGESKERIYRDEAASLPLVAGCYEFIQQLRRERISLAVASSGSTRRVRSSLEQAGLLPCFGAVVTGDDVPNGKPDPAIFLAAAERLQHSPAELLVAEDAVSGVRAAKAAGMQCLGIAAVQQQQALVLAGADAVLESFLGLSVANIRDLFPPPSRVDPQ